MGDFAESLIKRDVGVKDSGFFLPGHGGVLDRFDSLIFASSLTFVYVQLFF
jgi:phosphatidate cytidylyltransferase